MSEGAVPPARRRPWAVLGNKLSGGLLDSALSSLGTFLIGLAAVRYLSLVDLGAYALAYSGFLLGSAIPAMLVFTPAEVHALSHRDGDDRMSAVRRSLPLGVPIAVASGAVIGGLTLLVPSSVPLQSRLGFAVSLIAVCAVSATQDHLRRVLHMSGRSWEAARTSALQLTAITVGVSTTVALGVADSPLAPFGVLAGSNVVSSAYALIVCRRSDAPPPPITFRSVTQQGRSLLAGSVAQFSTGFLFIAIITSAAGPASAARFEAVRLLSQPVSVVIVGVLAVLSPRIMTRAVEGDAAGVRRLTRRCLLLAIGLAVPYAAFVSVPWDGNPLRSLVPRAFDVDFLLAAMVISSALGYAVGAYRAVPVARRRADLVLRTDLLTAGTGLALVVVLAERGAWAAVLATSAGNVLEIVLLVLIHRRLLRPRPG